MKSLCLAALVLVGGGRAFGGDDLPGEFAHPPDSARPGVYWYFMDGNLSREGITRDLESMRAAGLGCVIFLEVNVGVPRGPVDFLGEAWQDLFAHAVREAERLGIEITLGSGPGWTGSGGPWVKPEQSMQHLVASRVEAKGPGRFTQVLPVAPPRRPFFGDVPAQLRASWEGFYRDVAVLAFPTPTNPATIADVDEKALYYRAPFSSQPGVRPYLEAPAEHPDDPAGSAIALDRIVDLTDRLKPDGSLDWRIPEGSWTVMRFVSRNNGASTRPAPSPGIGFECDKFDSAALDAHFSDYVGRLLGKVGPRRKGAGWTTLHIDSWEMGAQNWTPKLREEFRRRRGYDPQPWYPTYLGYVVGDRERTERFLWDLRRTGHELVVEKHAEHLKKLGQAHGFALSIEPYDMHPGCDFDMGAVADIPMCEFWSVGFNTVFSCQQASSIAHIVGRPVVAAEAFTGAPGEDWRMYPGRLKNQGDWAFASGINRFMYHTFAHKPDEGRPGMVMGPYGVHWDRGQTWWPMAGAYHRYIARCQHMLRQGRTVADILYLMPEGAPNVFQPPASAFDGDARMPDRRGYNFDGCSADALIRLAEVRDGQVVFPSGAAYRLVVMPEVSTMTPELLDKLERLIRAGAAVIGRPPRKSPSLVGHPKCDRDVEAKAEAVWGKPSPSPSPQNRPYGSGRVISAGASELPESGTSIMEAKWIWYPRGEPAQSADVGEAHFRREFVLNMDRPPSSALLEMTADNSFVVSVNGRTIGEGNNFHQVCTFDVKAALKNGGNLLAVKAENGGETPNPAGLIAALRLGFEGGPVQTLLSDAQWMTSRTGASGEVWKPARVLGPAGMSPWRLAHEPARSDLYPHYDLAAGILAAMGVEKDFTATGPVRYTHRRTDVREIYFVANRTDQPLRVDCAFRVTGRTPEWWDPLTGVMRALTTFRCSVGRTHVPLDLEPFGSGFVVFDQRGTAIEPRDAGLERGVEGAPTPSHSAEWKSVGILEGPWDVAFDPAMGGPARIRFETLDDWAARPEPGIRYYSGIATYRRVFDLPPALTSNPESRLHLDLGEVHVMARVRVNGKDCGVVWTAPWRVDISGAVKADANTLEIEVANLWPNRMIGDARSPERTYASTTYRPYKADHALFPSGLRGPVRFVVIAR